MTTGGSLCLASAPPGDAVRRLGWTSASSPEDQALAAEDELDELRLLYVACLAWTGDGLGAVVRDHASYLRLPSEVRRVLRELAELRAPVAAPTSARWTEHGNEERRLLRDLADACLSWAVLARRYHLAAEERDLLFLAAVDRVRRYA